jgi:hypothetical protein
MRLAILFVFASITSVFLTDLLTPTEHEEYDEYELMYVVDEEVPASSLS